MEPRKNRRGSTARKYDESLKIAAARDYLTGNLSQTQVAEKYHLKGRMVQWFVQWYKKNFENELMVLNISPPSGNSPPLDVKNLEQELANANLKIAALEIMIEIAEKDFGIDIRKKRGTKQ